MDSQPDQRDHAWSLGLCQPIPNLTKVHLYASIGTVTRLPQAPDTLSTAQVATLAGIHRDTLLRWLRESLVQEPSRDRRGWRVFSRTEAAAIVRFAHSENPPKSVAEPAGVYGSHPEIRRLEAIDWDFRDAKTTYLTHGL